MANMLSGHSTPIGFQRLWDNEGFRDTLFSHLNHQDLISLRCVNRDCERRTTSLIFKEITIRFRATTFTKPAKLAALKRIGAHVKKVNFTMPYNLQALLPPLLEPTTGSELEFVYTPDCNALRPELSHARVLGQDDASRDLSTVLIKQYPPLYHAAVNVASFVEAFSCLSSLEHLAISCPSEDMVVPSYQSIVDYALISLRVAIERAPLTSLKHLTMEPVQPHALSLLNPVCGPGARPNSLRRWRQIEHLTLKMPLTSAASQLKQLHAFLTALSPNLRSFTFHWLPPNLRQSTKTYLPGSANRPRSTESSYFPREHSTDTLNRGANPLTLHLSSILRATHASRPRQRVPQSLPSMTSSSTLSSLASSTLKTPTDSAGSSLSSSPPRVMRHERPKLRCQPRYQRPASSGSDTSSSSKASSSPHSADRFSPVYSSPVSSRTGIHAIPFPKLSYFELDSISCAASEIAVFIEKHLNQLSEFKLEHTTLEPGGGDWDDALAPLKRLEARHTKTRWTDQKAESTQQVKENAGYNTKPHTPIKSIRRKPTPSQISSNTKYEEVPIILCPELSSSPEVMFSPVGAAASTGAGVDIGVSNPLMSAASPTTRISPPPDHSHSNPLIVDAPHFQDLADEIGLDPLGDTHLMVELDPVMPTTVKLPPELVGVNSSTVCQHSDNQTKRVNRKPCLETAELLRLSLGLPTVQGTPLMKNASNSAHLAESVMKSAKAILPSGQGAGTAQQLGWAPRKNVSKKDIRSRAAMVMGGLIAAGAVARKPGSSDSSGSGSGSGSGSSSSSSDSRQALEDGVRKLLAQTVYPYF